MKTNPMLYFSPGACSRVPLIMLEEIGESFDTELFVFMRGDHRSPDFLSMNPAGKIPVLIVDESPIVQNPAILLWLHEQHTDANVLPRVSSGLAQSQLLGRLLSFSSDLHPLVTRIRMPQFFCDVDGAVARVAEMGRDAISFQLKKYETILSSQLWLEGENWCALDAYLHWIWFRITGAGFDSKPFPSISAHYQRTLEIPAFQRAAAREQKATSWLEQNGFAIKLG